MMRKFLLSVVVIAIIGILPQLIGETTYFTSFAANFLFRNNLHEVVPNRFYRSAEMSREDLGEAINRFGIRTVIDLRLNPDRPDEAGITEREAAAKWGAKYVHIPFSSTKANQLNRVHELLETYKNVETPVLVHCSSGTHRSGVAAAIWLLDRENATSEKANEQMTLKYGFVRIERDLKAMVQGKPTLDNLLQQYKDAAAAEPQTFREWLERQPLVDQYVP